MEHLVVERLSKVFASGGQREVAVAEVSLTARKGEFVSLLGPSGCGKTTTLRCIAGLETPTAGEVFIGGEERTHATPQQRNVGMCFQEATVYPHMRIRDNLSYPLKLRGINGSDRAQRVLEMARILKIEPMLDKYPGQVSGGQRQRAALGRALIRRPELFLLDEPMSSLDAKLKVEMRKELKYITGVFGTTTLYVTHDQEEAMAMSDRICVMNQGRIEQFDTPETIYRRPATAFVAGFIGVPAMNLLSCRLRRDEAGRRHAWSGAHRVLADVDIADCGDDAEILVGVRPEDVILGGANGDGIEGVITLVEILGERTIVYLDSSLGEVRATAYGISGHAVGQHARIVFAGRAAHFFGADGKRLPGTARQ